MRLFVAVHLGDAVAQRAAGSLPRLTALAPRARFVSPEKLHVTLAFLGETPAERLEGLQAALSEVAVRHAPLMLSVEGGGAFGAPRKPRVLWAEIRGDTAGLGALQADVARALEPLGFTPERRAFTAHLTLARAKDPRGDAGLAEAARALADERWGEARVGELILFESAGGRYVPRHTAPLTGG